MAELGVTSKPYGHKATLAKLRRVAAHLGEKWKSYTAEQVGFNGWLDPPCAVIASKTMMLDVDGMAWWSLDAPNSGTEQKFATVDMSQAPLDIASDVRMVIEHWADELFA